MDSEEVTWLVEQRFTYKARDGRSVVFNARVSAPRAWQAEGALHPAHRCRVDLNPIGDERWVTSINGFIALCNSFDHIRKVLRFLVADGGKVYWEDSENHVDLDSPWFAPMSGAKELSLKLTQGLPEELS
jgi:hypothetical protein